MKRAIGYDSTEVTEEFSEDSEGAIRMVKRKVVLKPVPPDVSALKLLKEYETESENIKNLSDDELEMEKIRLIKLLEENINEDNKV